MSRRSGPGRSKSYRQAVHNLPETCGASSFISTIAESGDNSSDTQQSDRVQQTPETTDANEVVVDVAERKNTLTSSEDSSESNRISSDSSDYYDTAAEVSRFATVIRRSPAVAAATAEASSATYIEARDPQSKLISELSEKLHQKSADSDSTKTNSFRIYDDVPAAEVEYDDVAATPESDQNSNNLYHTLNKEEGCHLLHSTDTLSSQTSEAIYESVQVRIDADLPEDEGSDEFEPIESPPSTKTRTLFQKLHNPFKKSKSRDVQGKSFRFDETKHPPPQLPQCPDGLTEKQTKRRHVVASIVEIENSYVNSLNILVEYYKKPLLVNGLLPPEKVEMIFHRLEEVLDCHLMFRIALEASIKNWDEHEVIGNEFIEFSKEMVLESYSEFVNDFMRATELLKKSMKEKAFMEFVNAQMKASNDMVGPHGLMIKVVQRFPQYILQIKDLLKHTPPDHDDHLKLYMALSKLENVAYQLNVKKRTSEERLAARLLLNKISMKNSDCVLFRQDDVKELVHSKQKPRRLLLFNDMICLLNTDSKSTGNSSQEKLHLKWSCPVRDVEYHETGASPSTNSLMQGSSGTVLIQSTHAKKNGSDSGPVNASAALIHKELEDLLYDQTILAQIMKLTSTLRQEYRGLNPDELEEQLKNVQTSIRIRDEQLQMLDSCLICLSYLKNGQRNKDIYDMATPERKQDWVMDFRAVKLSQDSINHPSQCWLTDEPKVNYPLVIQDIGVDVTRLHTQVSCATPIFLTNTSGGIGLQYLWVCSSNERNGQVTLLSIHSDKPHIIECFEACDGPITSCALVPSNIHCSLDHVWMADSAKNIYVHGLRVGEWRNPYRKFSVPAEVRYMCCFGNHVFLALADGSVLKYAKRKGSSLYSDPTSQSLTDENTPVNFLLPCENNKILAACGNTLFILSTVGNLNILERHVVEDLSLCIDKMVKLGLGIWFSCTGDPNLRLIHHETYKNISEVHIGSALRKLLRDDMADGKQQVSITALSCSQGLIWVGCSTGHILTVPVPVLDGVPQQSGKLNLSSICHAGPVKFISTINCSITFAPQALTDEELAMMSSTQSLASNSSLNEEYDTFDEADMGRHPSSVGHNKRGSLSTFKNKVFDKFKQSKGAAVSTPNLAVSASPGLRRSSLGMYDSLMRLDDLDTAGSTTDFVNSLVPTNPLPIERHCTKISTQRGAGTLKVTKSSSISNLGPTPLPPISNNKRGVQSMWSLNTTSSHSVFSGPVLTDEASKVKGQALDQAYCDVNVELRGEDDQLCNPLVAKFNRLSRDDRDSRITSADTLLSRVEEDEEYIDESDEFDEFDDFDESGDFENEHEGAGEQEVEEALVVTNFLKASLIVSGGEGYVNLHQSDSKHTESTLIMWQQNQT